MSCRQPSPLTHRSSTKPPQIPRRANALVHHGLAVIMSP
jgi:hypothetical protein